MTQTDNGYKGGYRAHEQVTYGAIRPEPKAAI